MLILNDDLASNYYHYFISVGNFILNYDNH